jgi:hypothetical protein
MRQARPNESAITTAGRPGSAARSRRALASGSSGSRITQPSGALDWSTPAFAQTNPWRVRQISTRSSWMTSIASSSTACT